MSRGRRQQRPAAPHANECPRCGLDIERTADGMRTRRGTWIHKSCAGGADDE